MKMKCLPPDEMTYVHKVVYTNTSKMKNEIKKERRRIIIIIKYW